MARLPQHILYTGETSKCSLVARAELNADLSATAENNKLLSEISARIKLFFQENQQVALENWIEQEEKSASRRK